MGIRSRLGLDNERTRKEWDDRLALLVGAAATVLIIVTVVGAVAMIYQIFSHPSPPAGVNTFSEIFASRMMIAAARMAILFLGLFVVLSVLIHMRRGQWLTAAGPFKVAESVAKVGRTLTTRDAQLSLVMRDRERLRHRASELTDEVRRLEQILAKAQEQLRKEGD